MLPVRLFTLFSQLPATPCLRLLLKRESPHLSPPPPPPPPKSCNCNSFAGTTWRAQPTTEDMFLKQPGTMSAFCSCQVAHRRIKILCFSEVFIVRSRNFRRLRWRMRVIAVRRQAHGRSTEEDFPNECCGKVKFKFVVFEDEQGSTIVQAVSFASILCVARWAI